MKAVNKYKLIRMTTVPISLEKLIEGQLRYMNSYYHVIGISAEKENLDKLGKSQQIEVFHVEMTRKITPVKDFLAVVKLFLYLLKVKPFIVHSHTPKAGIVGMFAAKLAGVPHRLHSVAGLPLLEKRGFTRKVLDFVEKLTYSCATKVYPNSFGLRDIIRQHHFCADSKLNVLANGSSNGINTSWFDPAHFTDCENDLVKKNLGIRPNDFVFVFVGRLVKDKGINELIAAFENLCGQFEDIRLLLVGDYESDLDPLSLLTLSHIQSNPAIITTGFQNDVRGYFAISNALIFPTYREGFPNVVLQAGAMGLPCIVTDINGCNEIINDGENGLIIPVKDEYAIFDSMLRLYSDKNLYISLQKQARPIIVERYEQQLVWDAILQEYQNLKPHV